MPKYEDESDIKLCRLLGAIYDETGVHFFGELLNPEPCQSSNR